MDKQETKILDKLKYLRAGLQAESEKMYEIQRLVGSGWKDPGAELIQKEMTRHIRRLEESARELQNRIAYLEGKEGREE